MKTGEWIMRALSVAGGIVALGFLVWSSPCSLADWSYMGDLPLLVARSDVVAIGEVRAIAGGNVTFQVTEFLKGAGEKQLLTVDQGDPYHGDACMGELSWTIGETVCLFLTKTGNGVFEVLFQGSGKYPLPFMGYLDRDDLRTVVSGGRLSPGRIAAIVRRSGPAALTGVIRDRGLLPVDGPMALQLATAPAVQQALAEFLISAADQPSNPSQEINDLLHAMTYTSHGTLAGIVNRRTRAGYPVQEALRAQLRAVAESGRGLEYACAKALDRLDAAHPR